MVHAKKIYSKEIELELKVKPANIVFRLLLLLIDFVCISLAIGILFIPGGSPFGKLIGCLFLGAFAVFLTKSILWNSFGKEIYEISSSEFSSVNDYGWYKDKKKTTSLPQKIELFFIDTEYPLNILPLNKDILLQKKRDYKIVFKVDDNVYPSVVDQKKEDMEDFIKLLPEFDKIDLSLVISIPTFGYPYDI